MDPMSALAIATSVVQFVDFAGKIVNSTATIYKNADKDTERYTDLKSITDHLQFLNSDLTDCLQSSGANSARDQEMIALCQRCTSTANDLLKALSGLDRQTKSLWGSFRLALVSIWSQDRITELQTRLDGFRHQISMFLLVSVRSNKQAYSNKQMTVSLEKTQDIARDLLRRVDKYSSFQSDIITAINNTYRPNALLNQTGPSVESWNPQLRGNDDLNFRQNILQALRFKEIDDRYEKIPSAFARTFEWIFHNSPARSTTGSFLDWLKSDQTLYWITGKAGSGKSTLMKFIFNDIRLKKSLAHWARGRHLLVLSFYFWNSGTSIQMSREGLVRSLLFQALSDSPNLISKAFPNRLELSMIFPGQVPWEEPLSWAELLKAFGIVLQDLSETQSLFIFIDGLDEFDHSSSEIVQFVETLLYPNIKICVSSRPWVVFEDAFGQRPSLRVEDLTHQDIKLYIEKRCSSNRGFAARQALDADYSAKLIANIAKKASGVFLWVFLVVESLLEGLSGGERLSDLQARLDELPADLEELFWKILRKLDKKHMKRASELFQLLRAAKDPPTILELSFADEDDPYSVLALPVGGLTPTQSQARTDIMARRINECAKGLIEAEGQRLHNTPKPTATVGYLHRTVKDFWERDSNWSTLLRESCGYDPFLHLCSARIAMLKISTLTWGLACNDITFENFFWDAIDGTIHYAVNGKFGAEQWQVLFLEGMDQAATRITTTPNSSGKTWLQQVSHFLPDNDKATYWTWTRVQYRESKNFLEFAVLVGLVTYVKTILSNMRASHQISSLSTSALIIATLKNEPQAEDHEIVQLLLECGADPNAKCSNGELVCSTLARNADYSMIRALVMAGACFDLESIFAWRKENQDGFNFGDSSAQRRELVKLWKHEKRNRRKLKFKGMFGKS